MWAACVGAYRCLAFSNCAHPTPLFCRTASARTKTSTPPTPGTTCSLGRWVLGSQPGMVCWHAFDVPERQHRCWAASLGWCAGDALTCLSGRMHNSRLRLGNNTPCCRSTFPAVRAGCGHQRQPQDNRQSGLPALGGSGARRHAAGLPPGGVHRAAQEDAVTGVMLGNALYGLPVAGMPRQALPPASICPLSRVLLHLSRAHVLPGPRI